MIKDIESLQLNKPLHNLLPFDDMKNQDNLEFRNLQHFINVVSKLSQKQDYNCNISYKDALEYLKKGKTHLDSEKAVQIRELVRENLHKRGLLTEEVYEAFKYSEEGTQVDIDIGKFAAGEPDCVITPVRQYVSYFYELFINISYPHYIDNSQIQKSCMKLLSTIEELERKKIFIKITLVFPCVNPAYDKNLFLSIPLFSHKEYKTVEKMSSVINDRLLRKFIFAILEDVYGNDLYDEYGTASDLPKTMNIGSTFNECAFFEKVLKEIGFKNEQ